MIMTKKSKAPMFYIIVVIVMIGAAISVFMSNQNGSDFGKSEFEEILGIALPVFCAILGVWFAACAYRYSQSYITIYSDHIEGSGVVGKNGNSSQSFYLKPGDNYAIVRENQFLVVKNNGTDLYMYMDSRDIDEVVRWCNNRGATYTEPPKKAAPKKTATWSAPKKEAPKKEEPKAEPAGDSVICVCTNCTTKCRVPKGKGKISITCPRCGNRFSAET